MLSTVHHLPMTHFTAVKQVTLWKRSKTSAAKTDKNKTTKNPHLSFANLSRSELSLHLLTERVAAFPQQQGAENSNDAQVEEEAEEKSPRGPQEGRQHPVGDQRGFPRHHVGYDGLHLEVCPHHSADVEELVAVACETKSLCVRNVRQPANSCSPLQDVGFVSSVLTSAPKSPKICFSAAEKTCTLCRFLTI